MIKKNSTPSELIVPENIMSQWQELVNSVAHLAGIPAALIMRVAKEDLEVFVASQTQGNPYQPGDREHYAKSGLYCETVIKTKMPLLVSDALSNPMWQDNPDVKLNMIAYLGYPILFPDGNPFGTLCVLDRKPNSFSPPVHGLLFHFRNLIQSQLELLYMNAALGEENRSLIDYLDELQSLRGLIPICARCKKIKDSDGYWNAVEKFLIKHPKASFTHGCCPDCAKKILEDEVDI